MRIPRPIRWLLILVALAAGWAAGNLLDVQSAARESAPRNRPATAPATLPGDVVHQG
jgi:hypothetical protein